MGRKGQFKKGGGRIGDGRARKSHAVAKRKPGKTRTRTVHVTKYRSKRTKKHHRRRHGSGGGMPNPLHIALAAAGVSYLAGANGPAFVKTYGAKIPGAATFGLPAVVGLAALAADKFVKRNKWLRLAGYTGIVLAASKIGDQGPNFAWVGDAGNDYTGDVGDDDIGDVGDDDVGDYDD